MSQVCLWMACGLFITAYTGYLLFNWQSLLYALHSSGRLPIGGVLLLQVIAFSTVSAYKHRCGTWAAVWLFFAYSLVNGLTFCAIFQAFTDQFMMSAFDIAGGMFVGMSLYAYCAKQDLSSVKAFLFSVLLGLLLAIGVNFLHQSVLNLVVSVVGVLIYASVTSYHAPHVKLIGTGSEEESPKPSIYGALTLYLEFINIFVRIIESTGFMNMNRRWRR
jgi:FtsH-binding integral membrane protein